MQSGTIQVIGLLGTNVVSMYASNDFNGLTDDENERNYWAGSSWTSPIDPTDIQFTCNG